MCLYFRQLVLLTVPLYQTLNKHYIFACSGILTRNGTYDLHHSNDSSYLQRRKICDAIAVSSIFENCAGVDTAQNRYLGLKEFREFLEDYQEEHLDDQDIIALIQVSNNMTETIHFSSPEPKAHRLAYSIGRHPSSVRPSVVRQNFQTTSPQKPWSRFFPYFT